MRRRPGARPFGPWVAAAVLLLALAATAAAVAVPETARTLAAPQPPDVGGRSTPAPGTGERGAPSSPTGARSAAARRLRVKARERRASARRAARRRVTWRPSTTVGTPSDGRLIRGVRLPVEGQRFFSWDPVHKRSPNRWWRRYATDRLVRVLLRVSARFGAAHPRAPRLAIGDLSRPRGGDFGRRFGPVGHVSHQNGLDADVYLPRLDGRERAPRTPGQVDRGLAQHLVDAFVRAGAQRILVGPSSGLTGPPAVVQPWPGHEDHLHVRFAAAPPAQEPRTAG